MSTTEVGVAYVRLLPSMEGFAAAARRELGSALAGPARDAGEQAGKEMGKGLADGVDGAKGDMEKSATKLGGVLKAGLAAAGVAAGALMVAGINGALEQEVATDKLAAQLGGGEFGREMGQIAGNLYADAFGQSVADTADAVRKVWQNGLLPEDATNAQIEALTAKVMTFADVLEQDMDMTTQAVKSMLRSGIADSADEALDIMTRGVQEGADKAGDLAETFQEYSTNFREAGLTAAEATGLLVQGLNAGARDADKVADAIKEFGVRAKDGSESTAYGFELLGMNAQVMGDRVAQGGGMARSALDDVLVSLNHMEDPVKRNEAAVALFGEQANDLGDALFALDLEKAGQRLGDVAGSTDELGAAYDNAATKVTAFKRQAMQELVEFVGGKVIPGMEQLATAIGPTLSAGLEIGRGALDEIAGGLRAFRAAWQDNNGDVTSDGFAGVMERLANAARDVQPALEEMWAKVQDILPQIQELFDTTMTYIRVVIDTWVAVISRVWNMWGDEFLLVVRTAFNLVVSIISGAISIISGILKVLTAILTGDWSLAWEGIKQITSGAWTIIKGLFVAAFNVIKAIVSGAWSFIKYLFGGAMSAVIDTVSDGINDVVSFFRNLPGRIRSAFSSLASTITSPFSSAFSSLKKLWNDTLGGFSISIPSWVPKIGGNKFSIPKMHTGGIFQAAGGGREGLALLQSGEGVFTRDQMAALGGAAMRPTPAGGGVVISADGDQQFLAWLRHSVRVHGGGNVQVALGA